MSLKKRMIKHSLLTMPRDELVDFVRSFPGTLRSKLLVSLCGNEYSNDDNIYLRCQFHECKNWIVNDEQTLCDVCGVFCCPECSACCDHYVGICYDCAENHANECDEMKQMCGLI